MRTQGNRSFWLRVGGLLAGFECLFSLMDGDFVRATIAFTVSGALLVTVALLAKGSDSVDL